MARPQDALLFRAADGPAPQLWDERQGKFVVATGDNGAMHYIDKDKSKTFYRYKVDGEPDNALKGDALFYFDDASVYIYDGTKWVIV